MRPNHPRRASSGPFALEDRAGIDVEADGRGGRATFDVAATVAGLGEHGVVIIGADGVGGDASAQFGAPIEVGAPRRRVGIGQADDRLQARVENTRVEAAGGFAGEPSHLGGAALAEPSAEKGFAMVQTFEAGEAGQQEAFVERRRRNGGL